MAKAEANMAKHLQSIISVSDATGGVNGETGIDEKMYANALAELKRLQEARQEIDTTFGAINTNFDKSLSGIVGGSGGSSGGSGSGGSSSSSEIENIELKYNRYQQLEMELARVNDELERNETLSQNASGIEQVKYLEKEIELLKKKKDSLSNIQSERAKELTEMKTYLSNYGFSFSATGDFTDLENKIDKLEAWANSGDKKVNQEYAKKVYDTIDAYDELRKTVSSTNNEILELNNSIIDTQKEQLDIVSDTEKEIYDVVEYYATKRKEAKTDAIQEQIDKLNELYDLEDREDNLSEKQSELSSIKDQMELYENANDSQSKAKYESLKKQYDELTKELNTTIRDNQKEDMISNLESQQDALDKELEDFLKPENINKVIADAMKNGYVNIGDEVLDLNKASTQYLAETTVGTQNLINANTELINTYSSMKAILSDISKLNASLGNIGIDLNTVYANSRSVGNATTYNLGSVTVQVQGTTNMNEDQMSNAIQQALINLSDKLK